jgi:DNA-directed RNA polymerase specialized sigma24 family protein
MLAYWLSGSREVAEGTVSETFAAAARAWERADPSLPLAVWLARTWYERTQRAPSAPGGRAAELTAFLDPAHRAVAVALVELPFELRAAVILRCVVGFDARDAARIMDLPRAGFTQRLRQGLALLRTSLGDGLAEPTVPWPRPVGPGRSWPNADTLRI